MKDIKYNSNNDFVFDRGYDEAIKVLKSNMSSSKKKAIIKEHREALKSSGGYMSSDPNDYVIGFNIAVERFNEKNKNNTFAKKNWGKIVNINKYRKRKKKQNV